MIARPCPGFPMRTLALAVALLFAQLSAGHAWPVLSPHHGAAADASAVHPVQGARKIPRDHGPVSGDIVTFDSSEPPGTIIISNSDRYLWRVLGKGRAERYRISVATLRRSNRINGDRIRVGQVLTIPSG